MQQLDTKEHQRVEAALQASEAHLRLTLDVAELGMWSWDLVTGAGELDARGAAIVGLPAGPVANIGEAQRRSIHPDDLARLEADVAAGIASGDAFDLAYRVIHPNGTIRHVISRARALVDETGAAVRLIGTNRDVTRERETELQLRASEAYHAFLLRLNDRLRPLADPQAIQSEATRVLAERLGANRVAYFEVQDSDYVIKRDVASGVAPLAGHFPMASFGHKLLAALRSGHTMIVSDVAADLELSSDERAAYAALEIAAYIGVPLIKNGQLVAGLSIHSATPRAWTADEVVLMEETAERTWAAVERARAEQTLREREDQLQAALEGGQLGTWAWNPLTDRSQADQRTLALFGLEQNQPVVEVTSVFGRIHPDDLPAVVAALHTAQQPGGEYRAEFRVQLPDGKQRWLAGVGRGRFDADGRLQQVYGVNFDISARKRAESAARLLAELGEQIGTLNDADALLAHVVRLVGRHVQAARCYFAEVDAAHDQWLVVQEFWAHALPLAGHYRLSEYPPATIAALRGGELLICPDTTTDPVAAPFYERAYAPMGARALVVVPLLRQHEWVSSLVVLDTAPRQWDDAEIALLTTVAERTWNAVERLRLDAALRANQERYRSLLDSIDQGFCRFEMLYDEQGTPVDYRFLEVNGTFERHTGLRDVVDKTARELVPNLEPFWFATYGQVAATGQTLRFEQGSVALGRLFEVEAVRVGPAERREVAVIFTDVTERKRTEAQLAVVAARDQYLVRLADALRPLFDAVAIEREATRVLGQQLGASRVAYFAVQGDDYVAEHYYSVGVDSPTGRFSSASFGAQQLATYQAGRLVIDPDVAANPNLTPAEQATYAAYQIGAHVGVPLVKDGRFVAGLAVHQATPRAWTADEVALIEETAERTWAAIERARAEARLQQLYVQEQAARKAAEEASRLKDEFLATVSHELRTPLTAFLGYAELLQRRQHDEAYVRRAVSKMVRSARSQAALIEDLLDVSRIVSGKIQIESMPVNLIQVIHAALDSVRPSFEAKGLHVELALDNAASMVLGDANRLQQVVWNLLSNAVKFSATGGQITVQLALAGRDAELAVRDTGRGIDSAFLPYVFDRFRQADSTSHRAHGGLGLGLAIVRHLVELHGGTVQASSPGIDQGATFLVYLPLATEAAPQADAHEAANSTHQSDSDLLPLHGLRVLVVDDQPTIGELIHELLVADGATVQLCETATEALDTLRSWRPDVLVSDIAMPNQDGYWLIEQVRRLPPENGGATPAVALTPYVRTEDRLRVLAAGFQQHVTKPVDAGELRAVVLYLVAGEHEP